MNRRSFLIALAAGPALLATLAPALPHCDYCGEQFDPKNPAYEPELSICSDCFERERRQYFSNFRFLPSRKVLSGEIYWTPEVEADMMAAMQLQGEMSGLRG